MKVRYAIEIVNVFLAYVAFVRMRVKAHVYEENVVKITIQFEWFRNKDWHYNKNDKT